MFRTCCKKKNFLEIFSTKSSTALHSHAPSGGFRQINAAGPVLFSDFTPRSAYISDPNNRVLSVKG